MKQFHLFTFSLISLRAADVGITFIVSPDLRWEINPLVSLAGLGWSALILSNIVGVFLILFFYRYTLIPGNGLFPLQAGYSIKEFISHYLFGNRHSFRKIYYVVPHNKSAILQYCGYVGMRVITVWSLVVVIHNLLTWQSVAYRRSVSAANLWLIVYALLVVLVLVYTLRFFATQYAAYQKATFSGPDGV